MTLERHLFHASLRCAQAAEQLKQIWERPDKPITRNEADALARLGVEISAHCLAIQNHARGVPPPQTAD